MTCAFAMRITERMAVLLLVPEKLIIDSKMAKGDTQERPLIFCMCIFDCGN